MTDPVSTGLGRETSFDVFPDALSALPLPPLTLVVPPPVGAGGAPAGTATGTPKPFVPTSRATPSRPPNGGAGRTSSRPAAAFVPAGPPVGPAWTGYPPPGQPSAVQPPAVAAAAPYSRPAAVPRQTRPTPMANSARGVLAPGSGRRPVAGVGYTPPPTTASGVVRPPAYLPQNQGLAQVRAAVQRARGNRSPASPPSGVRPASPSAVRPAPPTGVRRGNRASGVWALFVFVIIFLVSSGAGQNIIDAISRLLHHR